MGRVPAWLGGRYPRTYPRARCAMAMTARGLQSPIRCGFWSEVAGRRLLWRAFPGRRRWMVEEGRFPGRNSVAEVIGRRGWRRRL
jgi:hypothetical protein